jgi:hypothetical protein
MAMMSDSEVRSLATTLENYEARDKRRELEKREEKKENHRKWMELLYTGAGVAGAAGIGFIHGRFEDEREPDLHGAPFHVGHGRVDDVHVLGSVGEGHLSCPRQR